MLIKNLLRIVKSYKFYLITIVFYEIIYLLRGFKGNKFHFSKNNQMSDIKEVIALDPNREIVGHTSLTLVKIYAIIEEAEKQVNLKHRN